MTQAFNLSQLANSVNSSGQLAGTAVTGNISGNAANVTGTVPVANGGTGTSSPSLVAGTGISISGSFPNQTVSNSGVTSINGSSGSVTGVIQRSTAINTTSGTSASFISIPSWVKRITVILTGVSKGGTSRMQIQIGSGSYTTSGYNSTAGSLGAGANNTTASGNITTGFVLNGYTPVSSETFSGSIVLTNITGNTWVAMGIIADSSNNIGPTSMAGTVSLSGTLDRVQLTSISSDTFATGSINIFYE